MSASSSQDSKGTQNTKSSDSTKKSDSTKGSKETSPSNQCKNSENKDPAKTVEDKLKFTPSTKYGDMRDQLSDAMTKTKLARKAYKEAKTPEERKFAMMELEKAMAEEKELFNIYQKR